MQSKMGYTPVMLVEAGTQSTLEPVSNWSWKYWGGVPMPRVIEYYVFRQFIIGILSSSVCRLLVMQSC